MRGISRRDSNHVKCGGRVVTDRHRGIALLAAFIAVVSILTSAALRAGAPPSISS
jgi:hypothetical protein